MKEREAEYLLKIAEAKSISKAADALFISQPALSKYLKSVEDEYGGKLFERNHGEMVPTSLGRVYLSYAVKIQHLMDERDMKMRTLSVREKHHILHFGIPASRVMEFSTFLTDLQRNNPESTFRITAASSAEIENMLDHDELDLALCYRQSGILLMQEYLTVLIPEEKEEELALNAGQPVSLAQLRHCRFLLSSRDNLAGRMAEQAFQQAGFHPQDAVYLDNSLAAWDLSEQGEGISFATTRFAPSRSHIIEPHIIIEVRLVLKSSEARKLKIPQMKV